MERWTRYTCLVMSRLLQPEIFGSHLEVLTDKEFWHKNMGTFASKMH